MVKEIITCGDIEVDMHNIHHYKIPIFRRCRYRKQISRPI